MKFNKAKTQLFASYVKTGHNNNTHIYDENILEKYLPWSKELPEDILNFQGTYEELKLNND